MAYTTPYYNAGGKAPIVQGTVVQSAPAAQDMKPVDSTTSRPCRDVFWALLFYAHLACLGYLAVLYAPQMLNDVAEQNDGQQRFLQQDNDNNEQQQDLELDPNALLAVLGLSSVLGFAASSLALGFMVTFAESLVKIALWFNIILFGVMAVLTLLTGALGGAVMCAAMCAFSAYYAWSVWSRVPFAASNLVTAVSAVRANLGLAFYAYTSLLILVGWSVFWSVSSISTIYATNGCNAQGECQTAVHPGVVFLFLVSYYWTIQVISNVVHVTTSGTIGTWWMSPGEANGCCSSAVRDSYVRSITTSFGSICFGSLIVAIIQAVKEMIHSARENGDSSVLCGMFDWLSRKSRRILQQVGFW